MPTPNTSRVSFNAKYCPLATDEDGNPLAVPAEAAFWRVRRDTGGRPKIVNGPDMKPLTLPLEYPPDELMNLLGRGSYRLDLYDDAGQHLETVAIKLGTPEPELRNRAMNDADEQSAPMASLPATGSDVRLVLEANVRATQLAFQHNERTLAASLKIAETLREGVHVLAESQADWIKSLAASRGFFRNAMPSLALPQPSPRQDDDDGELDDEDEDDELEDDERQAPSWVALLKPAVEKLADTANTLILAKAAQSGMPTAAQSGRAQLATGPADDIASRGFEVRELYDFRYAAKKGAARRAAAEPATASEPQLRSRAELQSRIVKDPALVQRLMQVNALLRPEETERIMTLVTNSPIERQEEFLTSITTMSIEQAVEGIRCLLEPAGEAATEPANERMSSPVE